jgi:hypothetical protein
MVAGSMSVTLPAHAAVTAFFSAGASCGGANSASYQSGATTQVSLCVTTTTESMCGYSVQLQAANVAQSGQFQVTSRTLGAAYPDANYYGGLPYPVSVSNPTAIADFGGTVNGGAVAPAANQLLATFNITPTSAGVSSNFVISTGSTFSAVSVDDPTQPGCGNATDVLIPATFTLNYVGSPAFTSANTATFTVNSASSFTVTASGAPTPTLSIAGALPAGVTFTPATGVISGTPTLVGNYPITITAANGNLPNASQNFTLVVQAAQQQVVVVQLLPQNITFAPIADRALGTGPVTLSATGGGSGNPVTFSSSTANVCTVSGNAVTLVGVGACTIAANQAGNSAYSAAAVVTQTFNVTSGLPNAPTGLACSAVLTAVRCTFTAPVANGAPVVTSYTLSCSSLGANGLPTGSALSASGSASPLTVSGLTAGITATCTATANNSNGSSPQSNAASASPYATTALHQGIDPVGDGRGRLLISIGASAGSGSGGKATLPNGSLLLGAYDPVSKQITFSATLDPGPNRRILGVGDFGGRNRSDLLFQDIDTGLVTFWVGFDGFVDNQRLVRTVKPGWVADAVADLDGDGKSDIVWRYVGSPLNPPTNPDDIGVVFVWFMKDGVVDQVKARGGAPLNWTLVGAADLRGVGTSDLIWVSPGNQIRSLTSQVNRSFVNELIGNLPDGYTLTRLGDFDGDGKADLLFRNAQGKLKLWTMSGINISRQIDLPDSDATWSLYAIADLNGDGTMDLIFKKPDNTLVIWLMNQASPAMPTVIDNAGSLPSGAVNIDP